MRYNKKQIIWCSALMVLTLLPLMIVTFFLAVNGKSISDCKPVWGDEIWWYLQAKSVAEFGSPLGYFGYNGSTAPIGTFGTWGPAMVLPYALFGKIFGWVCAHIYGRMYVTWGLLRCSLLSLPEGT